MTETYKIVKRHKPTDSRSQMNSKHDKSLKSLHKAHHSQISKN